MSFLPILNYHGLYTSSSEYFWKREETPYAVNLSDFQMQIGHLASNDMDPLNLKTLFLWSQDKSEARRPFMITFDDGHISNMELAAPVLRGFNLTAVFFITANLIGKPDYMTWEHVRHLKQAGMEIGSHGLNHTPYTALSEDQIETELVTSKKMIEENIGDAVTAFSVPGGFYKESIAHLAWKAGYRSVFTSNYDVNYPDAKKSVYNRMAVMADTSFEGFQSMMAGKLGLKKYTERVKTWARSAIPPAVYFKLSNWKQSVAEGEK